MIEIMNKLLPITIVIFMFGNLLEMGLKLKLDEALQALRNVRFVTLSLIWCFVLGPLFAVLLTKILPLAEPYALGLILLGMVPCAPFMPIVAQKARGDLAYVATFMLLAAVGTVVYMPLMVPVLCKGITADTWTIAKPLVLFIAFPLALGIAVRRAAEPFAEKAHPIVKKVTGIDTLLLLIILLLANWRDFLGAVGTYAIATQFVYYGVLAAASYGVGFGLSHGQKSVLALGVCTRNTGPAIAPLYAVAGADQRAITMCVMSVYIGAIVGFATARVLSRLSAASDPAGDTHSY
ncbi:MAG: bile acid:sodium symporter [Salinivirgaceae bacterium]|nr:bile acid:sodium symporter [Desulfobacterales bacterium]MDY0282304.1 bile acid:sodium symporter [Salinivirgaceae bacterium]